MIQMLSDIHHTISIYFGGPEDSETSICKQHKKSGKREDCPECIGTSYNEMLTILEDFVAFT